MGSPYNGAYLGARILHEALLEKGVNSTILNDSNFKSKSFISSDHSKNTYFINNNLYKIILNKIFVITEKILKTISYLPLDQLLQLVYLDLILQKQMNIKMLI